MGKTWMIASGKGGAGKSTVAASLATALAQMKRRVCIVDADIGLRDQDILLRVENNIVFDLLDVCDGTCVLEQALVHPADQPTLSLLPAAQFARVKDVEPKELRRILRELRQKFDFVFIDCPAGMERGLRNILKAGADALLLVCTPDDVCIRNADRVSTLVRQKDKLRAHLIVNRLIPDLVESGEMYPAQTVADTLDADLLGEVPEDPVIYRTLIRRAAPLSYECPAKEAFERIARRMTGENVPLPKIGVKGEPWYKRIFHRS